MKRNLLAGILTVGILLVMAALAAPGGAFADSSKAGASGGAQSTSVEITIDNFSFTPAIITVKTGTKITWKNRDDIPHTVVSSDSLFKSKALDTDDTFSFTPSNPGTYLYFCSLHPKMTGKVVVE